MRSLTVLTIVASFALIACAGEADDDPGCAGKCDDLDRPDEDVPASPCDGSLLDLSGRGNERVAGRLGDKFARDVLMKGDSCPTTFAEMVDRLDGSRCEVNTHVVSEQAHSLGVGVDADTAKANSSYRTVTAHRCGDEPDHTVMFSQFGLRVGAPAPDDVEVAAFDESTGVFNYYKLHPDGTFAFFGNSLDFVRHGAGEALTVGQNQTRVRNCAQCHTGGGLIMKELEGPWLHWLQNDLPGAEEIVEDNGDVLGEVGFAIELEAMVKQGNREWNEARIDAMLEDGDAQALLRPLFCAVEIQLESKGNPMPTMTDPALFTMFPSPTELAGDVPGREQQLADAIADLEQTVLLGNGLNPNRDSVGFQPMQPVRSFADSDYVERLVLRGLISQELASAVRLVDFTRPVFSDDRCELLELVPAVDLASDDVARTLQARLLDNLDGRGGAGGQLRGYLERLEAADDSEAEIGTIVSEARRTMNDACRASQTGIADSMTVISLRRSMARTLPILEFPGTLPFDRFQPSPADESTQNPKLRFSPKSCQLVTRFVSPN